MTTLGEARGHRKVHRHEGWLDPAFAQANEALHQQRCEAAQSWRNKRKEALKPRLWKPAAK